MYRPLIALILASTPFSASAFFSWIPPVQQYCRQVFENVDRKLWQRQFPHKMYPKDTFAKISEIRKATDERVRFFETFASGPAKDNLATEAMIELAVRLRFCTNAREGHEWARTYRTELVREVITYYRYLILEYLDLEKLPSSRVQRDRLLILRSGLDQYEKLIPLFEKSDFC